MSTILQIIHRLVTDPTKVESYPIVGRAEPLIPVARVH